MTIEEVINIAQKHGLICEERSNIPVLIRPQMTEAEFHSFFEGIGWNRSYGMVGRFREEAKRGKR